MKYSIFFFLLLACRFSAQTINTTLTYSVNMPSGKKEGKPPVLIMLHGYGSNESDLFEMAQAFDGRFITFSLRAPFSTKEGGFCWYDLEFMPDQQFKYNYRQAKESRTKILSFIGNACKAYQADSTNVFVLGFSQGAIMCYDMALAAPAKLKGVLALSGRMMEESRQQPTNWAQAAKVKFFIAHGNSDNVIKIAEAEKVNAFLKSKKVTGITYKNYETVHTITGQELNDIKSWLVKAITPAEKKPSETKK